MRRSPQLTAGRRGRIEKTLVPAPVLMCHNPKLLGDIWAEVLFFSHLLFRAIEPQLLHVCVGLRGFSELKRKLLLI